jgi:hypothetical protein
MSLKNALLMLKRADLNILRSQYFTKTPYLWKKIDKKYLNELYIIVSKKND